MLDLAPVVGIPRKVLKKAHQLGVHNDCIISQKPCTQCSDRITLAFDFYYAHCTTEHEMLTAIVADFRDDIEAESW